MRVYFWRNNSSSSQFLCYFDIVIKEFLHSSDRTSSQNPDAIRTHHLRSHPTELWKYSAAFPKDILPQSRCLLIEETRDHLPVCHFARQPLATTVHLTRRALRQATTSPENVRLTAKVTWSNASTPRSLFQVAGSRTNNICRALIPNPRVRRFDPRSPEPPVSLSTPRVHQQPPTYLPNNDFTLRHAVPRGIRRCRTLIAHGPYSVRGVRRPSDVKGGCKERGLIIISSGVPEHPWRCLAHVRTQPARRSRSWEQRDLLVRMIKREAKRGGGEITLRVKIVHRIDFVCTRLKCISYCRNNETNLQLDFDSFT